MPEPVLRLELLGNPTFSLGGGPVAVDTRKALAVLAVLAVAVADGAGPVSRAALAVMFWPDADETRARGALRRTLSVLAAATGEAVTSTRTTVALRPVSVVADVVDFRRLLRSADLDDLARAVALVRGEFLAGFTLRDCAPFDDWTAQTSAVLRRELDGALERLVAARLGRGDLHAALADALRWLELDPLHEPAHRTVLRLLAWTGRRQDAIEQYRRCVRVLGDTLGVAPVRATTQVYEAIRTGTLEPPPVPRADRPGPRPPTGSPGPGPGPGPRPAPGGRAAAPGRPPVGSGALPMVGRDAALATLLAAAGRAGRAIVVTAESGAGRSRLVEEFAARTGPVLLARAHGGEAALSFAPIADLVREAVRHTTALDPDVAVEVSRIVPECLPAGRGPAPSLTSLGARDRFYDAVVRVLAGAEVAAVVLEDVHAASTASAEVLAYLLHRLDRLRCPLVLTWRDPGLPPRHPVRAALAGGRLADRVVTITLPRLTQPEVAQLAGGALDVRRLWSDTAGLPMLVVAAIRAGGETLPASVREMLGARLAEVSEETAQVLAALAVHGGAADPAVLRATSGRGEVETVVAVEEALRAGLVREEHGGIAFTHDALRRVAGDQLSQVRRRLLHTRAAEVLAAGRDADARAGLLAHHWHEAGRDDLAAGWAWTAAAAAAALFAHEETLLHLEAVVAFGRDGVDVALTAGAALVALGRYEESLGAFGRAAALVPVGDHALRARIERRAADVHTRMGEWVLADTELAAAVLLLDTAGVWPPDAGPPADDDLVLLRAHLLADRAVVASRAGQPGAAARYVSAARSMAASVTVQRSGPAGPPAGSGGAHPAGSGGAHPAVSGGGQPAGSGSVEPSGPAGVPAGSAYIHDVAGVVALAAGDPAAAQEAFTAALAAGPDIAARAAILNNLSRAQAAAGSPASAVETARAALALGRTHGDRHRLAALHTNLADRLHDVGSLAAAHEHLLAAAALFAEVGSDPLARPDIWTLVTW